LLALEAPAVRRDLRRFVPSDYRADFDQIWRKVRKMLYAYVRGQFIIAALIGICSGVACAAIGLPDPIALGLIAGVTALIPYLGPFIGAVPAILVGLSQSPGKALLIGLLYLLISNVILNFIYPRRSCAIVRQSMKRYALAMSSVMAVIRSVVSTRSQSAAGSRWSATTIAHAQTRKYSSGSMMMRRPLFGGQLK
jgi:predicted PurR-regulated permease PerM